MVDIISKNQNAVFLVTGGAGFIGSNICEALLERGANVICLDNLSTGKEANILGLMSNAKFKFIKGDITDLETCIRACQGVDYVISEAALSSVPVSIEKPLDFCANNILGFLNMLEASSRCGVKRFVYATSASVYGDEEADVMVEGREGNLLSPYALSKRCDEEWAKQYYMHYGLETVGLRYFNVYGKRQDPKGAYAGVIPKFVELLLNGKTPTIYGDGLQSRDFVYIKDVVEANILACFTDKENCGQVYNVAYGESLTLNEIYDTLSEAVGYNQPAQYGPEREGDIKFSSADISKAKERLNYAPSWSFKQGIKETLEWYKSEMEK